MSSSSQPQGSDTTASHPLAPSIPAGPGVADGPAPAAGPSIVTASASAPAPGVSTSAGESELRHSGDGEVDVGIITPPVPKCHLRVLIISGQSHVFSFEPEITVGRMKEILWSSWPSEWTDPSAPPSPAFLRVLYSGRILQDDSTLSSNNLPTALQPNAPTVIHISVRSFSLKGDEGDPKKGFLHPTLSRNSRRNEEVTSGGCKCVIM